MTRAPIAVAASRRLIIGSIARALLRFERIGERQSPAGDLL